MQANSPNSHTSTTSNPAQIMTNANGDTAVFATAPPPRNAPRMSERNTGVDLLASAPGTEGFLNDSFESFFDDATAFLKALESPLAKAGNSASIGTELIQRHNLLKQTMSLAHRAFLKQNPDATVAHLADADSMQIALLERLVPLCPTQSSNGEGNAIQSCVKISKALAGHIGHMLETASQYQGNGAPSRTSASSGPRLNAAASLSPVWKQAKYGKAPEKERSRTDSGNSPKRNGPTFKVRDEDDNAKRKRKKHAQDEQRSPEFAEQPSKRAKPSPPHSPLPGSSTNHAPNPIVVTSPDSPDNADTADNSPVRPTSPGWRQPASPSKQRRRSMVVLGPPVAGTSSVAVQPNDPGISVTANTPAISQAPVNPVANIGASNLPDKSAFQMVSLSPGRNAEKRRSLQLSPQSPRAMLTASSIRRLSTGTATPTPMSTVMTATSSVTTTLTTDAMSLLPGAAAALTKATAASNVACTFPATTLAAPDPSGPGIPADEDA